MFTTIMQLLIFVATICVTIMFVVEAFKEFKQAGTIRTGRGIIALLLALLWATNSCIFGKELIARFLNL